MSTQATVDLRSPDEPAESRRLGQVVAALSRHHERRDDRHRSAGRASPDHGQRAAASVLETVSDGRASGMARTRR